MVLDILKRTQALLDGHFLLSSGKHSNRYVQCARLLQYPEESGKVIGEVVKKIKDLDFDIVVGPAMGGIIVAYEIGRQVGKKAIFTERENNRMVLRRGFQIERGQRVLISEDVVTTGKSSLEVADVVRNLGGEVVAIACIVDRSKNDIGYPIYSSIRLDIETFESQNCPLCKEGISYEKPGSRKI